MAFFNKMNNTDNVVTADNSGSGQQQQNILPSSTNGSPHESTNDNPQNGGETNSNETAAGSSSSAEEDRRHKEKEDSRFTFCTYGFWILLFWSMIYYNYFLQIRVQYLLGHGEGCSKSKWETKFLENFLSSKKVKKVACFWFFTQKIRFFFLLSALTRILSAIVF